MSRIAEVFLSDWYSSYPVEAGYKRAGTSKEAAQAVQSSTALLREQVLAEIVAAGANGLTPDEVADLIGRSVLGVRPRVSELKRLGKVIDTGRRRPNASGMSASVICAA